MKTKHKKSQVLALDLLGLGRSEKALADAASGAPLVYSIEVHHDVCPIRNHEGAWSRLLSPRWNNPDEG